MVEARSDKGHHTAHAFVTSDTADRHASACAVRLATQAARRMARARGGDVIQIGIGLGLGPYLYNIIPPSPSHPAGRLCR